uniref:Mediator of RNA polymerase II transcription subunit 20 n=1 Tax=Pavo cristatus TaxID=9049 RepID=A0A8C9G0N5_PAVCR
MSTVVSGLSLCSCSALLKRSPHRQALRCRKVSTLRCVLAARRSSAYQLLAFLKKGNTNQEAKKKKVLRCVSSPGCCVLVCSAWLLGKGRSGARRRWCSALHEAAGNLPCGLCCFQEQSWMSASPVASSVTQVPVLEGKSVQQTVELLSKKLELLGAEKHGAFGVDCETYHTAAAISSQGGQRGERSCARRRGCSIHSAESSARCLPRDFCLRCRPLPSSRAPGAEQPHTSG